MKTIEYVSNVCLLGHPGQRSLPVKISRVSHEFWLEGTVMEFNGRDRGYALALVDSGSGVLRCGERRAALVPDVVIVYGREGGSVTVGKDKPLELRLVSVRGPKAVGRLAVALGHSTCSLVLDDADAVRSIHEVMLHEAETLGPNSLPILRSLLDALILKVAQERIAPSRYVPGAALETYRRCRRHIRRNAFKITTVEDVARECAVSHEYMCRLFRRFGGHSPLAFLTRLRMQKAGNLLLGTNVPIRRIAYDLDYDDPGTFCRAFRRSIGMSPSRYRREFGA